jgi:hypothetical protein
LLTSKTGSLLVPIGTLHKSVPLLASFNVYYITVAPESCQSFTVIWHADLMNSLLIGDMRTYPYSCQMDEVHIYDKKCSPDPTPTNPKIIRNELDELHLEVKCPKAGIITIALGFEAQYQSRPNISVVEGLLSGLFEISFFF